MASPSPLTYCTLLLLLLVQLANSQVVSFDSGGANPVLARKDGKPAVIFTAPNEQRGVVRAAHDLALDFGRVMGVNGTVHENGTTALNSTLDRGVVLVGTIGHSTIIDHLAKSGKIDVSNVKGKWESYVQASVEKPLPGISHALVIAGSDKRGTIYGIYDISETMGVSPWYYWSDVPAQEKDMISLLPQGKRVHGPPSVKHRGIFINDEFSLSEWTEGKFPPSPLGNYFTAEFHKLIFEPFLRCKANYFWPGMKQKAFYVDDPENGPLADLYGIIIGTSHHEPMARAYWEQDEYLTGTWDWSENKANVTMFMEEGVQRTRDWETLYTMGMRGDGDRESATLTAPQLEEIISLQQGMIENITDKDLEQVPQTWALYKEVGKYWQAGMEVSDLVTLMWTDDNFGNLLRTPLANETGRRGGAGVYYHFGYVGDPRNYEWINTIQLVKTWEQMHLAYEKGARTIWICNSQDLKPYEVPTAHFLEMAYDMTLFETPDSTTEWLVRWATQQFGASAAVETAEILNVYGRLIVRRKYETLTMDPFAYSKLHYDEALRVMEEWRELAKLAQDTYDSLDNSVKPSFFQLVLHPVLAGGTVVELYIINNLGFLYKSQLRTSTNALAGQVRQSFARDAELTSQYNGLFNSRWNHIIDDAHIGYSGRNPPSSNVMPPLAYVADNSDVDILGIAIQGQNTSYAGELLVLRSVDPYMAPGETRYIDIFTRVNGTFSYVIKTNASYVSITNAKGTLSAPGNSSDTRAVISIDWANAPPGTSWATFNILRTENNSTKANSTIKATIHLPINHPSIPPSYKGHISSNGAISIEAAHWSTTETKNGTSYIEIPHYGRTLSGVKIWPVTATSLTPATGPKITYNFYSTSSVENATLICLLGGSLDHDPTRPLKVAYSLDEEKPQTKRVFADYLAGEHPIDWDTAAITGGWNVTASLGAVGTGSHRLSLWLLEPGVVLQKVMLDLGGLLGSGLGAPESFVKQ
ncbi:hypothetical protein BDV19DRAFT_392699 [Aspergillus venezuelensis]